MSEGISRLLHQFEDRRITTREFFRRAGDLSDEDLVALLRTRVVVPQLKQDSERSSGSMGRNLTLRTTGSHR